METHVITWTEVVLTGVIKEHLGSNVIQVCWFICMKMVITKLISNWKIGKNRKDTFIYLYYIFKRKACPNGKYGNNCQRQCNINCGVKARCERLTGQCEGGCKIGWKGITCDKRTICLFFVFFSIIVFGFLLKYILSISTISTINSKQGKSMKNIHNDWDFLLLKIKYSLLLAVALNSYQALVVQEHFFQIFLRIKFLVQTFILKECDSFFTVVSLTYIPFSVTDALKT